MDIQFISLLSSKHISQQEKIKWMKHKRSIRARQSH